MLVDKRERRFAMLIFYEIQRIFVIALAKLNEIEPLAAPLYEIEFTGFRWHFNSNQKVLGSDAQDLSDQVFHEVVIVSVQAVGKQVTMGTVYLDAIEAALLHLLRCTVEVALNVRALLHVPVRSAEHTEAALHPGRLRRDNFLGPVS